MENIQRENADILDAVWAALAQTVIPPQPVSGQAYRNAAVERAVIQLGQKFNSVADSALFNQFLYLVSNYGVAMGERGILPWISAQGYRKGGLCIGPDGSLWQAQTDIEAGDTTVPGTDNTKWDVPIFNGQKVFSLPQNGQQGQILTLGETGAGWTNQGNYQNAVSIAASTQLDESHLGCVIDTAASAGIVLTLPLSNEALKGKKITFSTRGAGIVVNPAAGDTLVLGNFRAINTLPIPIYSSATVVSLGGGLWKTISEMPSGIYRGDFGYRVYPDGLIEQWGIIAPNVKQVTFHLPFTKVVGGNISWANANPSNYYSQWLGYSSLTTTGFVPGGNINETLPYSRFYSFIGE